MTERSNAEDAIGAVVGMSRNTLKKAKEIVSAAETEPEKHADLQEELDKSGNISKTYRRLKHRQETENLQKT